jgi:hypothetical protein
MRDTWQCRMSPQQGGEVRAMGHVAVAKLTSARRRGPGPWDTW